MAKVDDQQHERPHPPLVDGEEGCAATARDGTIAEQPDSPSGKPDGALVCLFSLLAFQPSSPSSELDGVALTTKSAQTLAAQNERCSAAHGVCRIQLRGLAT